MQPLLVPQLSAGDRAGAGGRNPGLSPDPLIRISFTLREEFYFTVELKTEEKDSENRAGTGFGFILMSEHARCALIRIRLVA